MMPEGTAYYHAKGRKRRTQINRSRKIGENSITVLIRSENGDPDLELADEIKAAIRKKNRRLDKEKRYGYEIICC